MQRGTLTRHRGLLVGAVLLAAAAGTVRWATAADHRDSTVLTNNPGQDIADVYSFRSPANPNNLVLAMTVAGLIPPAEASTTFFSPDVLYEFKIDTDQDAVEDLVIQAAAVGTGPGQVMFFRGPIAVRNPSSRRIDASVRVSNSATPIVASGSGLTVFAGVRDDPFFFDLGAFRQIIAGQASSFNNPGTDTFAGTNVLAIVVELPISALQGATTIGVWGTTSRRI